MDPSYRLNVDDLIEFPWLDEAPDNRLHSPAVISDKVGISFFSAILITHLGFLCFDWKVVGWSPNWVKVKTFLN